MQDVTAAVVLAALGVAASPLPIVAVLVMLLSRRAAVGSIAMASAWVLGNVVAITIAINFASRLEGPVAGTRPSGRGSHHRAARGRARHHRMALTPWAVRSPEPQAPPRWVAAVDGFSPAGGAFVAFTNATTSPKNLALALSAGLAIQSIRRPAGELTGALIYVLVACTAVVVPVVVYFAGGHRSRRVIERWKRVITSQAAAIMEFTLLVLGVALMAKGLYNLLT